MVFKFLLSIPPFSWRLASIRSGHQYPSALSLCKCRSGSDEPIRRNAFMRRILSLKINTQLTPDTTVRTQIVEDIPSALPSYDLSECSTPRKVGLTPRSGSDTPPPTHLKVMKFVEEVWCTSSSRIRIKSSKTVSSLEQSFGLKPHQLPYTAEFKLPEVSVREQSTFIITTSLSLSFFTFCVMKGLLIFCAFPSS